MYIYRNKKTLSFACSSNERGQSFVIIAPKKQSCKKHFIYTAFQLQQYVNRLNAT